MQWIDKEKFNTVSIDHLLLLIEDAQIFDILSELYSNRDSCVQNLLCSKLYEFQDYEIEFLLPQLCNILINRSEENNSHLENFLIDRCSMSIHFGISVYFIIQSAIEDEMTNGSNSRKLKQFLKACKVATINGSKDKNSFEMSDQLVSHLKHEWSHDNKCESVFTADLSRYFYSLYKYSANFKTKNLLWYTRETTGLSSPSDRCNALEAQESSVETSPSSKKSSKDNLLQRECGYHNDEQRNDFGAQKVPNTSEIGSSPTGSEFFSDVLDNQTYHQKILNFVRYPEVDENYDMLGSHEVKDFDGQLEPLTNIKEFNMISKMAKNIVNNISDLTSMKCRHISDNDIQKLSNMLSTLDKFYGINSDNEDQDAIQTDLSSFGEMPTNQNGDTAINLSILSCKVNCQIYFYAEIQFLSILTGISGLLKDLQLKNRCQKDQALRACLFQFNISFCPNVYIPIPRRNGKYYQVIRIPYEESFSLSSKKAVPYMVFIECVMMEDHAEVGTCETAFLNSFKVDQAEGQFEQVSSATSMDINNEEEDLKEDETGCHPDMQENHFKEEANQEEARLIKERIFGESWEEKKNRIRRCSPAGYMKNWDLIGAVVKYGDDLRQEQLATQLIYLFFQIFKNSHIPLWVYPYEILAISPQAGFIEAIPDAISIDIIKQQMAPNGTLEAYFNLVYGVDTLKSVEARRNFAESLAAYSLICYILQIKDRHNGNIMLDREGHLIHVDYGFMLSSSPGWIGFESAPFKLNLDFVGVMGGRESAFYKYFRVLFKIGFLELRNHSKLIVSVVEMMLPGSKMPCFSKGAQTIKMLEGRFKKDLCDEDALKYAESLIQISEGNWRTDGYDRYQWMSNGIY
ncbi:phosphatidylinositol 4-kinase beta-like [Schistocerca gregaria]|uniref:phosphatidylinositol 4-kinase beta-like n=1 Tax=Schistocerca gregaria TaxID=7010 RepID=UPI00211E952F|nr:phosphatidylinositol 4-kinase beta-like [Schistocerca gregaria]